jgi:hypothetical protein
LVAEDERDERGDGVDDGITMGRVSESTPAKRG